MSQGKNRGGRPRKSEGPRVPYEEVDRILVFGEVVPSEGGGTTVSFPTYRELGERYGVSHSVIADYAKTHNVQRRRKEAEARIKAKAENKLVELRSSAIALSKDDELRIIDRYLAGFEEALGEGRVRFDNPADFNTMVRLKEFMLGNADSRQEIHASLSLEALQARHRQMLRTVEVSPAERGEQEPPRLPAKDGPHGGPIPPAAALEGSAQEPTVRFPAATSEQQAVVVLPPPGPHPGPTPPSYVPHATAPASTGPSPRAAQEGAGPRVSESAGEAAKFHTPATTDESARPAEPHADGQHRGFSEEDAYADTIPPPPGPAEGLECE